MLQRAYLSALSRRAMTCRRCGQPVTRTRYGLAHVTNPGPAHHYAIAKGRGAMDKREAIAAEIHATAHPEPLMDCPECDERYIDSLSLDAVDTLLETSIQAARR